MRRPSRRGSGPASRTAGRLPHDPLTCKLRIIADLDERGAKVVFSQRPRRAAPRQIYAEVYKWRHLIENFFCKLNEFKRIAMRSDKTDLSFSAMIYITAAVIHSR